MTNVWSKPSEGFEVGKFLMHFMSRIVGYDLIGRYLLHHTAAGKWRVIALTNNWSKLDASVIGDEPPPREQYPDFTPEAELQFLGWEEGPTPPKLRAMFDDFLDSSACGTR